MFSLYPGACAYQTWFSSPSHVTHVENGFAMTFPESLLREKLTTAMPRYPEIFASGNFFRRGGHTLTGIVDLDGTPVFGKHIDFKRKKFYGRLRYNLMPSRGLWAAFMANVLTKAGLSTPKVLGAGEIRENGLLAQTYFFTEVIRAEDAWQRIKRLAKTEHTVNDVAISLMQALRKLHDAHVSHGDVKLDNFYFLRDGTVGFWDLDPTLYWPSGIPATHRYRNAGALIANLLIEADTNLTIEENGTKDAFIERAVAAYGGGLNPALTRLFVNYRLRKHPLSHFL